MKSLLVWYVHKLMEKNIEGQKNVYCQTFQQKWSWNCEIKEYENLLIKRMGEKIEAQKGWKFH